MGFWNKFFRGKKNSVKRNISNSSTLESHTVKPTLTTTPQVRPEHGYTSEDIMSLFLAHINKHCTLMAGSPNTVKALQDLACDAILKELEKYIFSSMVKCLDGGCDRIVCNHKFVEKEYLIALTVVYAKKPKDYITRCFRGNYLRYLGRLVPEWPTSRKSLAHWIWGIGEEKQILYLSFLPHKDAPKGVSFVLEGDIWTCEERQRCGL